MAARRSPGTRGEVDDVVVFDASILTDEDDVEAAVREVFMRAGNIADARKMQPPISVRLIDSEGQCLISRALTEQGANPGAQPDKPLSSAAPVPWFLVLEDEQGKVAKVRLETGPRSIQ
jgi:hypothetical protein